MKIFILADGSSSHTKKWVNSLLSRGLQLYLFSFTEINKEIIKTPNDRLLTYSANIKSDGKSSILSKLSYLKLLPVLKGEIARYKPDLLHAHYISSYGLLAFLSGFRPYLLSVWGSDLMEFPDKSIVHREIIKTILKYAKKIFASSEILMSILSNDFNCIKTAKIPFGVDTDVFCHEGKKYSADQIRFVIVKSLTKTYGIDIAIKAFISLAEKYPEEKIRLDIYGDGGLKYEYEQLAYDLLGEKVFFHGKVPHEQVVQVLRKSDIILNVSRRESFGVSVIEASACGLAVIASNRGGLPEVVLDGQTGLVLNFLNVTECFKAMEKYLKQPDLIQKHGSYGRRFVEENYDEKRSIDQQIREYKEIIK